MCNQPTRPGWVFRRPMKSQLQGFFVGEKIRQLLDCDAAFVEHCECLNYKAEPSRDPKLVSPTMGRALLVIALCYGELADSGNTNKGLYEAASTITALICDRDEKEPEADVAGGRSLTLKRLLGRRGGMAVAQTITRVLVKVDQLAPWDEEAHHRGLEVVSAPLLPDPLARRGHSRRGGQARCCDRQPA